MITAPSGSSSDSVAVDGIFPEETTQPTSFLETIERLLRGIYSLRDLLHVFENGDAFRYQQSEYAIDEFRGESGIIEMVTQT